MVIPFLHGFCIVIDSSNLIFVCFHNLCSPKDQLTTRGVRKRRLWIFRIRLQMSKVSTRGAEELVNSKNSLDEGCRRAFMMNKSLRDRPIFIVSLIARSKSAPVQTNCSTVRQRTMISQKNLECTCASSTKWTRRYPWKLPRLFSRFPFRLVAGWFRRRCPWLQLHCSSLEHWSCDRQE